LCFFRQGWASCDKAGKGGCENGSSFLRIHNLVNRPCVLEGTRLRGKRAGAIFLYVSSCKPTFSAPETLDERQPELVAQVKRLPCGLHPPIFSSIWVFQSATLRRRVKAVMNTISRRICPWFLVFCFCFCAYVCVGFYHICGIRCVVPSTAEPERPLLLGTDPETLRWCAAVVVVSPVNQSAPRTKGKDWSRAATDVWMWAGHFNLELGGRWTDMRCRDFRADNSDIIVERSDIKPYNIYKYQTSIQPILSSSYNDEWIDFRHG
jgi:hypothetical protein